jgi:hypothetical protein
MNTTASFTRYRFDMMVKQENSYTSPIDNKDNGTKFKIGYYSGIQDYALRTEFDYTPAPGHDIKFGAYYTDHTFKPGVSAAKFTMMEGTETTKIDTSFGDRNVLGHEINVFAEDNLDLGSFIKADVGVNYSMFLVQGQFYQSLEPRLSMRMLLNDKLSIKAGYAGMSQYIHLLSNSSLSLPTDLWVPVTKRIKPMDSKQYSLGIFYNLKDLVDLSVESYYKDMNNLIEYKDGAGFLGSSTGWEDKVCIGRGWSYGVEFLAQKSVGKTTGWLAYTWSKSERQFDRPNQELNFGRVFPAKYDRRHNLSLTVSHRFSDRFDLSGTWVYYTGNSGTLALQQYEPAEIKDINAWSGRWSNDHVSERNNYRLPDYHRMDIGVNFHKKKKHGVRTWNLSFYNAYNQKNPFMVYQSWSKDMEWNPDTQTYDSRKILVKASIFPIIPSLSYSYKF